MWGLLLKWSGETSKGMGWLTSCYVQSDFAGAAGFRVAANHSAAESAVVPSEGVVGEFLLAKWASRDTGVFFPRHYGLLNLLPLRSVTEDRP